MKHRFLSAILSIGIIVFSACIEKRNGDITRLVREWKNREILFPNNFSLTLYGQDTVQYLKHSQYTIVNYVDSAGCFSCKLQLPMWREFIFQLDSIYPRKVAVLFFLHSKSEAKLWHILKQNGFDYPICIDEEGQLDALNHFPSDVGFQTFLLDRNNKVLAIGNPIHNPKVKELYLKIIQGESVGPETNNKQITTQVDIAQPSVSMKNFDWEEEQKATFTLKNTGDNLLVIQDVTTSCGCTTVSYDKAPIQPGAETTLEVSYKAERPGYFNKTLTVYCNVENSPLTLRISGNAK